MERKYCLDSLKTKQNKNMEENKTNFKSILMTIISNGIFKFYFFILANLKEQYL